MKSIVWCINIVIILFCSIAYADQRTVVSFDDLSRLPLLAGSNQLRLANNDNPDYKGIVWDDDITVFGENYKICADCPVFGVPRSASYAITNHDDLSGITLTTSKILLGFWAGQNEYYGYGGGSKQIIVHALDADGKSLQSVSFDLPDSLQGLAEPLSYVDTSVFLTCSAIIQGYRIEKSQSCTSDCNWVADDFTFTEKDNGEKLYTQAELDAKYEAGKQACIDDPLSCGIAKYLIFSNSANPVIQAGLAVNVYGNAEINKLTLKSGASAKLINFVGNNEVTVQADSTLFNVSRSGATVTFKDSNGTVLTIPATKTAQTIIFNDFTRTLMINNNQVMLGNQVINLTPSPIL